MSQKPKIKLENTLFNILHKCKKEEERFKWTLTYCQM